MQAVGLFVSCCLHLNLWKRKLRPSLLKPLHTGGRGILLVSGAQSRGHRTRPCSLPVLGNDPGTPWVLGGCLSRPHQWALGKVPGNRMPLSHGRAASNLSPCHLPSVHSPSDPQLGSQGVGVCICLCVVCVHTCVCEGLPRGKGPAWEGSPRISGALISKANPMGGLSQGPGPNVGHGH